MIVSLALILIAQLIGEIAARASGLPVPGPVIGAALLVAFLALRDRFPGLARMLPRPLADGGLEASAKALLVYLPLMFVPAGAGIVGRLDVLAEHGSAIAVVIFVSVILTLAATALTFVIVSRLIGARTGDGDGPR